MTGKRVELLEDSIGECLHDLGIGKIFLNKKYKGKDNLDCIKMSFFHQKTPFRRLKREVLEWEIYLKHMYVQMTHNQKRLQKHTYK